MTVPKSAPREPGKTAVQLMREWVRLEQPRPEHYGDLFGWRQSREHAFLMQDFRPSARRYEELVRHVEGKVRSPHSSVWVAIDPQTEQPIGYVQAEAINHAQGTALTGGYIIDKYRLGFGLAAIGQLFEYMMERYNLRKLYFQTVEYNRRMITMCMRLPGLRLEARERSQTWYRDQYWDRYWFALHRSDWEMLTTLTVDQIPILARKTQ